MNNQLEKIVSKAYQSKLWLGILNLILGRVIPFNSPHKFRITELSQSSIKVKIPYIHRNLNHLKGIHACALATASEYACGFLLISNLSPSKYRLIMRSMKLDFIKQGKKELYVHYEVKQEEILSIKNILEKEGTYLHHFQVEVRDAENNLISMADLEWQLKDWKKINS